MSTGTTDIELGLIPVPQQELWVAERIRKTAVELRECIEVSPEKLGGVPVVKGTRISVAQILGEISEGQSIEAVAEDFGLDAELIKRLISGLAVCFDRPMGK